MPKSPTPDTLDHRFDHWQHPQVRDLAWLLETPDLLQMNGLTRPSLKELGLAEPDTKQAFLCQLENNPEQLASVFGNVNKQKLGLYHEKLWQLLLSSAPRTRLLANNLPIIENRRTLGELDLLYSCRESGLPIHLELTAKYYLGLPDGPGSAGHHARWIGPGCRDSLAMKSTRLMQHQLPIAHTPQARNMLSDYLGMCPPGQLEQRLAIPGVLFYPLEANLPAPRQSHPQHLKGTWLHWENWKEFIERFPAGMRGGWLSKPYWLAPPPPQQLVPLAQLTYQLAHHFTTDSGTYPAPTHLALHYPQGYPGGIAHRWLRVFVMHNEWPHLIPLAPQNSAV